MIDSAYEWIPPKTDWKVEYDSDGNYVGDYFEPEDYNRIKNNVNYLRDFVEYLFARNPEFEDLGEDVYYGSPNEMRASWWTKLQNNLDNINRTSINLSSGKKEIFISNEKGRLLEELIRIETMCLNLYSMFVSIEKNKPRLDFRLGSDLRGVKI